MTTTRERSATVTLRRRVRAGILPISVEARLSLMLRVSVALVYIWFGLPKFWVGLSPAEPLAVRTTEALTFGVLHGHLASVLIAAFEVAFGLLLLSGRVPRLTFLVFLGHIAGTAAPLILFPEVTWVMPVVGTLEGQYILKNVVLIAAVTSALVLTQQDRRQRRQLRQQIEELEHVRPATVAA
ncbi:hypothetical protein ACIRBX_09935 [Kitasatospora sp. NPDC096147]|uniref:hypothetical protein n=1 Tax=Kitasatospora sp. NPDC096147 TaxID=3364093 RepID=UPI003822FEFA